MAETESSQRVDQRKTCMVALHRGYGERDQQAAKIVGLRPDDEGPWPSERDQNRYAMMTDA